MCSSSVALSGVVIGRLHYCVGLVGISQQETLRLDKLLIYSSREEFVAGFIGETL